MHYETHKLKIGLLYYIQTYISVPFNRIICFCVNELNLKCLETWHYSKNPFLSIN